MEHVRAFAIDALLFRRKLWNFWTF